MQRGKRFSFSRLMLNSFPPNQARDDSNVDLLPTQADNLLRYQLSLPHPQYLAPLAFFTAGITGSETLSKQVHKALVKAKIILPVPPAKEDVSAAGAEARQGTASGSGSGEKMTVSTAGIGKGFPSQLAIISIHAQRKLVGLLFFWEEECTRWKFLDDEAAEIRLAIGDGNENSVDLHCALAAVEMRRRMLPSQRRDSVAGEGAAASEELPGYEARR